jgi:putative SOS response-associated peptidase YedK
MCGRFFLQRDPAAIREYFETSGPAPNHAASWNVAPTQDSLVVRRHPESGERHLSVLRWGLVPRWVKDPSGGARLMNARADTVAEKPSFRDAFAKRRCLVPMDGFYEWKEPDPEPREAEGPRKGKPVRGKQPYACALRSGEPMAVAGLWEGWKSPEGEWLRTFSVITTEANAKQALVHHRMPAILAKEDWPVWLGEAEGDPLALLKPCPPEWLRFWPVDSRVGRVAENDAKLLQRDPLAVVPAELDEPP